MPDQIVHVIKGKDLKVEKHANSFPALLRQDGDQIRRDVFIMINPEETSGKRIMSGYTTIYPKCTTRGHAHPDKEEVYYFLKGSGKMVVDGVDYEVTAGDTFYIHAGNFYHSTVNPTDFTMEYFWITIKVD